MGNSIFALKQKIAEGQLDSVLKELYVSDDAICEQRKRYGKALTKCGNI